MMILANVIQMLVLLGASKNDNEHLEVLEVQPKPMGKSREFQDFDDHFLVTFFGWFW